MARHHQRDIGSEIDAALADPILKDAMSRAMGTMLERRAAAWPDTDRFEALREKAREIKEESLDRQDELLDLFERQATGAGALVYRAADGAAARKYICDLMRARSVDLVVKAKSMTSEEIKLGPSLAGAGAKVIEGDLGERIIQLAGEHPSHLVVPAIHKSREEVIRLLSEKMRIADPPEDAEGLTRLVRADLRNKFLRAGMGVTGANFAIAETGSIVLVENEGNASLSTLLPPIHVAVIGREKLIRRLEDLAVFLELLPRSATGQKLTSYVSVITGRQSSPSPPPNATAERECHLVILDNGRSAALADAELRETLRCIRCGACLNACAPYNLVGGHVYGSDPYPGGIGCAWTYLTKGHSPAWDVNGLCTTCSRCTEVCPVKIDIPWLNTLIRQRNNKEFGPGLRQRIFSRTDLMGRALGTAGRVGTAAMGVPPTKAALGLLGIDASRKMPAYHRETFRAWWTHRSAQAPARTADAATQEPVARKSAPPAAHVALFVDCFVNHNLPHVGKAAVEVLEAAGAEIVLAQNECCGRAAMSQGLLEKPREWALKNVVELASLVDRGYEIVFIEPSCLSAVSDDYSRLLESTPTVDPELLRRVQDHSFDVTEYLVKLSHKGRFDARLSPLDETYIVHGHCHQKSLGIGSYPADLLRLIPDITIHEVEALCCGMVGSFGYKKEYSALSKAIGGQLFEKISAHPGDVAACGISCRSQIEMGTGRRVLHPVEVLASALQLGN